MKETERIWDFIIERGIATEEEWGRFIMKETERIWDFIIESGTATEEEWGRFIKKLKEFGVLLLKEELQQKKNGGDLL